ncbi:recombinase family protein [Sinirhodobacter populi]|uniref:Recombinase family protein n=2 Tax=Alphaproteobacteria TaxID=28211 RepID=A0A443K1R1_9RHOB|nr:recombinase family protein [Sinirhodobacter populi]RWR26662.1 recombinase family protein [Sinirhodobacter populi]
MKVAIYARYSSDNQRDASIADQLRMCRLHAEKQGWRIVEEYTDHAISGASLLRPGIQALISDAARGRFDLILSEAMDRLSRDQEDIAGIFKRMSYADVKIVTLSEGEVTHLHVGLKGTMNALFLKDLADKTRRGQRGRVEAGKSGGGNAYGYDVVKKLDANGEPVRGDRTINEAQAHVVRRIFRDYAAGKSAKTIAFALNRDGIPAPSGGDWGFSTINGNPKRGNGILNNEMYVGRIVWNRQRFIKDPDTGKRQARPNPEEDWVIQEATELKDALSVDDVKERGDRLRARKAELTSFLAPTDEPPPLLHPAMAQHYRQRVQQLYETLQDDSEERRIEAAEVIRSLVEDIILTPVEGKVEIDIRGDLVGILTLSAQKQNPAAGAAGLQVKMVAGGRFNTRPNFSRPMPAFGLHEVENSKQFAA